MVKSRDAHKILVVGLPPGSTSTDLQKLVKPIGNPLSATMAVDAEGRERGFGFVQFADAVTQQAAIEALDKTALAGRTLNVRAVEERAPSKDGSARAGPAKGRPCYDFARGKCARGAACKWAHITPPTDGESSRRPDWQKKRALVGSDTATQDILADIPEDYCRKYQLGSCHRGSACRWKHIIWKGAAAARAHTETTMAAGSKTSMPVADESCKRARTLSNMDVTAVPIGGVGQAFDALSSEERAEELRDRLKAREIAWRDAHPGQHMDTPIPEEARRRDVVWAALSRQLQRVIEAKVPTSA